MYMYTCEWCVYGKGVEKKIKINEEKTCAAAAGSRRRRDW